MTAFIPAGKKEMLEADLEFDLKNSGTDLLNLVLKQFELIFKVAGLNLDTDDFDDYKLFQID